MAATHINQSVLVKSARSSRGTPYCNTTDQLLLNGRHVSAQIQQVMHSNLVHLCLVVVLLRVKHTIWEHFQLENFLEFHRKNLTFSTAWEWGYVPNLIPRPCPELGLGVICTTWLKRSHLVQQVVLERPGIGKVVLKPIVITILAHPWDIKGHNHSSTILLEHAVSSY